MSLICLECSDHPGDSQLEYLTVFYFYLENPQSCRGEAMCCLCVCARVCVLGLLERTMNRICSFSILLNLLLKRITQETPGFNSALKKWALILHKGNSSCHNLSNYTEVINSTYVTLKSVVSNHSVICTWKDVK